MFWVTVLKILGRVVTLFFGGGDTILCVLKGISPFKMHTIIFFPENLEIKILGFTSKFTYGQITQNMYRYFLFSLKMG